MGYFVCVALYQQLDFVCVLPKSFGCGDCLGVVLYLHAQPKEMLA